jgi:hypothetical protein
MKVLAASMVLALGLCGVAEGQTTRHQLWRGVWISLPEGAEIQPQPRPIRRVRKQVFIDGAIIDLVRQKKPLPYGAEFERRWWREFGYRNITVRSRGNSYFTTYTSRGIWSFNRKVRLSSRQMVEAYFSVPVAERHSDEARRLRAMLMSISLRRK